MGEERDFWTKWGDMCEKLTKIAIKTLIKERKE